jgi:hypothetical protein
MDDRGNQKPHVVGLKKDMERSRKLHKKYVEYGFRRFDGAGVRFQNRRWKDMCFGYIGERCKSDELVCFAERHLRR